MSASFVLTSTIAPSVVYVRSLESVFLISSIVLPDQLLSSPVSILNMSSNVESILLIIPSAVPWSVIFPSLTEPEIPSPAKVVKMSSTVWLPLTVTVYNVPLFSTIMFAESFNPSFSKVVLVVIALVAVPKSVLDSVLLISS